MSHVEIWHSWVKVIESGHNYVWLIMSGQEYIYHAYSKIMGLSIE